MIVKKYIMVMMAMAVTYNSTVPPTIKFWCMRFHHFKTQQIDRQIDCLNVVTFLSVQKFNLRQQSLQLFSVSCSSFSDIGDMIPSTPFFLKFNILPFYGTITHKARSRLCVNIKANAFPFQTNVLLIIAIWSVGSFFILYALTCLIANLKKSHQNSVTVRVMTSTFREVLL